MADRPAYNRRTGLYDIPFARLVRAALAHDGAEVGRAAERIGPARLATAVGEPQAPETILAALEGISALPGRIRLLEAVTPLCRGRDGAVVRRAAAVLGDMLGDLEGSRNGDWEAPPDAVGHACLALQDLAARAAFPLEVRRAGIDALAQGGAACVAAPPLINLTADPEAEIRRAALLALRRPTETVETIARERLNDGDSRVAGAAAVVWCARQNSSPPRTGITPPPPPDPLALARLRQLALSPTTLPEDAVDILLCLARSAQSADQAAVDALARGERGPLRDRARDLLPPPR